LENKQRHIARLNPEQQAVVWKVTVNACRFVLAVVFIFSGFVKAVDPTGTYYKIQDYIFAFGMGTWMVDSLLMLIALCLSILEFTIGIYLFFGIRRNLAPLLTLLFMSVMTPLTLYLAISNPITDCGCFGDAVVLTNQETFVKNLILLAAAIILFRGRAQMIRLITHRTAWMASTYTLLYAFALSIYCLYYLPILDFRPYKVSTDIRHGIGQFDPRYQDFYLTDPKTGEEVLDTIIHNPDYTFLLIAHRIENADDSNIDLINELYDYCVERNYRFYALTSSPMEEVEQWRDKTGAEYPFLLSDDIALKTIIRSNPGLLLLKDGVVLGKWSHNDLPDEYALTDRLDKLPIGRLQSGGKLRAVAYAVLWFFIPLLLIVGIDRAIPILQRIRKRRREHLSNKQE
jgi:uncharacterized membrane protein YphA (DoxX/SURF4 family)